MLQPLVPGVGKRCHLLDKHTLRDAALGTVCASVLAIHTRSAEESAPPGLEGGPADKPQGREGTREQDPLSREATPCDQSRVQSEKKISLTHGNYG